MDFPEDIGEQVKELHNNLAELMKNCDKLLQNYQNIKSKCQESPLELASLDLTISFAINSLFWCTFIFSHHHSFFSSSSFSCSHSYC
jgi:hypothetical protein